MPDAFQSFLQTISTTPGTTGGGFLAETGERLSGLIGGKVSLFRYPTGNRARAIPVVAVPHPETGQPVYFRHVGRPILFSGDVATAKRVRRVASRLHSKMGLTRRPR